MEIEAGGPPARPAPRPRQDRIFVEHASGARPFMRGILVHSLMARGLSFEDAYRIANDVRDHLRGRGRVPLAEVRSLIERVAGAPAPEGPVRPPLAPAIRVRGERGATPFSKGFLSQSLLAAAIEPNDAFDVAREIEAELLQRGTNEIDRRELRRLAYHTLERRIGPQTAERYLVWRRYHDPDRPVILLLGGATGTGKTALAVEVAHRLGIDRVLSTDSIRQIMRIMLSRDLVPALHASSYDAHVALGPPQAGEDPVVQGFLAQASTVCVGVRAMLDRAVAERSSLILDGVSIVPGALDLEAYRETAYVIFLVVASLDEDAFRARFETRGRESGRPPHRYLRNLDAILRVQEHFLELADRHDVPIVDNDSFDASILSIVKHVTESLRKRGGFDAAALL